jgi:MFS family permease
MTTVAPPLAYPAFRWLLAARTTVMLGNAVAPVALAFAVLDLTGSASDVGIVVAARSLANVLLLLFGGVLADRFPRVRVLVGSSLAAAATQGAVAALVLSGEASIPLLAVLSALNGASAAVAFPASAALTPQTVPQDVLQPANALLRLGINGAAVLGAALGGILVAVAGPGWGIAVDAVAFALAALLFSRLRVTATRADAAGAHDVVRIWTDLSAGWSEFVSRRWVWVVVAQFAVVNACLAGVNTVLGPAVADETFGRGGWGVVLAAESVGLVAGGILAMRIRTQHLLRLGVAATAAVALPMVALALAPAVLVLLAAFFLAGVAVEQFGVAWDVSLQEHVPQHKLARVYSYDALGSFIAIPAGQVVVGPLSESIGLQATLLGSAAAVALATGAALLDRHVRTLSRARPSPAAA